jgi:hypothetical protein
MPQAKTRNQTARTAVAHLVKQPPQSPQGLTERATRYEAADKIEMDEWGTAILRPNQLNLLRILNT